MPSSSPPPDRFQREIDDIIRLAERRLERQSPSYRVRKAVNGVFRRRGGGPSFGFSLPAPEMLAGWGLALMLVSFLVNMLGILRPLGFYLQVIGVALLVTGLILSLLGKRGGRTERTWRGERIEYGSPYGGAGSDVMRRLRRFFGRR